MPTTAVPVTAIRLDKALKERIEVARGEIARATPGLTPSFSDTVRVLINEALAARESGVSPNPLLVAHAAAERIYNAAVKAHDAAGLAADDDARSVALSNYVDAYAAAEAAAEAVDRADALRIIAARNAAARAAPPPPAAPDGAAARRGAARVPASRGAGGITLHRATNGASVATVVANDPK